MIDRCEGPTPSPPRTWLSSRVTSTDGRIIKGERSDPSQSYPLAHETEILQHLIAHVPKYHTLDPRLAEDEQGRLVLTTADLTRLGFDHARRLSPIRAVRLVMELIRISRAGVAHGDVRLENVFWKGSEPILVDFDQARQVELGQALLSNLAGSFLNFASHGVKRSFMDIAIEAKKADIRAAIGLYRHLRSGHVIRLPSRHASRSADASEVRRIWKAARSSPASAPGVPLAYYEWSYQGLTFPGERPWEPRWQSLRTALDWSDAVVIELGSNLGLLSTHLTAVAGARSAVGIDHDPTIVRLANDFARWRGANSTRFEVLDLNCSSDLDRLAEMPADIVTVLNVLNWVARPDLVARAIPHGATVVLEAHDALRELQFLAEAGFGFPEFHGKTERGRELYVVRSQPTHT